VKRFSLRYTLLTARFDQVWFPLAFWALFVIIGVMRGPEYIMDTTRSYLGAVVPLIGGILSAYAVLDDPALELRFATPITAAQTLLERLGPAFLVQSFSALTFQVFALLLNADFSIYTTWMDVQLAWLVPTLALMALGCLGALAAAQTITGALLTGMVWIVELVARAWFAGNPSLIETTAFRNGSLQGGYLILAARALGLDCGPMSGFDNAKLDAAFFPDGKIKSNFLVNLGYGDPSKLRPRGPRLSFDEACRVE